DVEALLRRLSCPKVAVIHEGVRGDIGYDLRNFDAVVVFDERYEREVVPPGVRGRTHVIPYPCIPPVERRVRAFAEDTLRFFSFGRQPASEYREFVKALGVLSRSYDFEYLVFRSDGLLPYNERWLRQETLKLDTDELYEQLLRSDIHLLPKGNTRRVVVSSTFSQCVGALTPIVAPHTRHFENLPEINGAKPAVTFTSCEELIALIERLIEDDVFRKGVVEAARIYAERNSVERVAGEFLRLFESL
ncbi:MAG: glycosyltransferase family protein, partial [Candidatus Alkanophagales archaeon]